MRVHTQLCCFERSMYVSKRCYNCCKTFCDGAIAYAAPKIAVADGFYPGLREALGELFSDVVEVRRMCFEGESIFARLSSLCYGDIILLLL